MAGGSEVDSESVTTKGDGYSDYDLVVRSFIAADKPHLLLPYNTITVHKTISSNLANGSMINQYNISTLLIGTYAIGLVVRLVSTTNFMNKLEEGVNFQFYVNDLRRYFVQQTPSSKFMQPIYTGSQWLLHIYYQPKIPLPLEDNPDFTIWNGSGTNLAVYISVLALDVS